MTANDENRLKHMLEAAEKALIFAHGKSRDDLSQVLWQTLQQDLQPLIIDLQSILSSGGTSGSP